MDRDHHVHFTQKLHKLEYVVPPLDGLGQGAISDITRGWGVGVEWGGGERIRMVRRGARAGQAQRLALGVHFCTPAGRAFLHAS